MGTGLRTRVGTTVGAVDGAKDGDASTTSVEGSADVDGISYMSVNL